MLLLALGALGPGCSQPEPVEASEASSSWPLHAHPGECRGCHSSLAGGLPTAPPPPGSCAASGCHRSFEPPPRLVHGPVAAGDCNICHVPHSSVEPYLVSMPAPRLCTGCHDKLYTCHAAAE